MNVWELLPRQWDILKAADRGEVVADGRRILMGGHAVDIMAGHLAMEGLLCCPDPDLPHYRPTRLGAEALRRHNAGERVAIECGAYHRIVNAAEVEA